MDEAASYQRSSAQPTTLLLPGLPTERPLLSRWCGVQRLAVYAGGEAEGEEVEAGAGLCHVTWDAAQWNSITRRLVNQSHGFFMSLHELSRRAEGREGGGGVQPSDLLLYSHYYRSALRECVTSLRAEGGKRRSAGLASHYLQQADVYAMMELVWHLCEILFIEVLPAGSLVQQLLEWVVWHRAAGETQRLQEMLGHTPPDSCHGYWRLVYRLVLTGRLQQACNLLNQHSAAPSMEKLFSRFDELLRKAPMVRSLSSHSRAELQHTWQQWRRECCARRDGGDFIALPQLQLLTRVLCGEEEVFKDPNVVGSCDSWYELMVARILFTSPLVVCSDYEFTFMAEESLKIFDSSSSPSLGPRDRLLLSALRQDALEVVSLASSELSSWWLAAHLADLLDLREGLTAQTEYSSKLSEFLMIEYATSLLIHKSLWEVAMDYLGQCSTQGRHHMALHIERIPLTSEKKALKVYRICEKFKMNEEGQSVCRVMAMREFRSERLGAALSWCLRAKDATFAAFLAENYFDSYQTLGEFLDLDLLDHLGSAMLLSEKLTFLGKYREFHQLYQQRSYQPAGQLLVTLLHSNIVPRRFWMTLLTDALPLLSLPDQVVFTAEQTMTLSHCLQLLSSAARVDQSRSSSKSHDSSGPQGPLLSAHGDKISLLRLALCRNLARASLEEMEEGL